MSGSDLISFCLVLCSLLIGEQSFVENIFFNSQNFKLNHAFSSLKGHQIHSTRFEGKGEEMPKGRDHHAFVINNKSQISIKIPPTNGLFLSDWFFSFFWYF